MTYKPHIPKGQVELYRAVALAHRRARRKGGRQKEWHWAAVRAVIEKCPERGHREADEYAGHIVRYVSLYYREWFWG